MDLADLIKATHTLERLISEGANEAEFQRWFEENPVVFLCYGYSRWIPQPRLPATDSDFVPDFLAQRANGLWEIVEIKTSGEKLAKEQQRRNTLYAPIHSYIRQCIEYSEYFDERRNREETVHLHGAVVAKSPPCMLVVGTCDDQRRPELERLVRDGSTDVRIQTYTDVLLLLQHFTEAVSPKRANWGGWTFVAVLRIHQMADDCPNFLLDAGSTPDGNRISIFVDRNRALRVQVIDELGETETLGWPIGRGGLDFDAWTVLLLEVAGDTEDGFIALEIFGQPLLVRSTPTLGRVSPTSHLVLGSDIHGREMSRFDVSECALFNRLLDPREKQKVALGLDARGCPKSLAFVRNQCMYTPFHPSFSNALIADPSDLMGGFVQEDPGRQPIIRDFTPHRGKGDPA